MNVFRFFPLVFLFIFSLNAFCVDEESENLISILNPDAFALIFDDLEHHEIWCFLRTSKYWLAAAEQTFGGYLALRFGHITKLPLEKWRPPRAAENGYCEVIKWLYKNNSYDENHPVYRVRWWYILDKAAEYGHLTMVDWIHNNVEGKVCSEKAMNMAAESGYLDVVIWLHNYRNEGCTTDAMDKAARNGYLNVVKWLHDNRPEGCTFRAMDYAAMNGHFGVVKWLQENRSEGCSHNGKLYTMGLGHREIYNFLQNFYPDAPYYDYQGMECP